MKLYIYIQYMFIHIYLYKYIIIYMYLYIVYIYIKYTIKRIKKNNINNLEKEPSNKNELIKDNI